jgi:REP element-mobilizing transposase RayT
MPRKARIDAPGALHYVFLRGIQGEEVFQDDTDRDNFVDRLAHLLKESSSSCFAWALMPTQIHLLLKTGKIPISRLLHRLLTGYVVTYNSRHRRHGPIFRSRYGAILCQEDPYLLELVRYIHLNPLQLGIVRSFSELARYRYGGHSFILAKRKNDWQDVDHVLRLFGSRRPKSLERYHGYIKKGLEGSRKAHGQIRGGTTWSEVRRLRKELGQGERDERILGDSHFVRQARLNEEKQSLRKRELLPAPPRDLEELAQKASALFGLEPEEIQLPGKSPVLVKARSLFCFWAVGELRMTASSLARKLGISQPAVSISVRRGAKIASEMGLHPPEKKPK